jgi:hypothetical protein
MWCYIFKLSKAVSEMEKSELAIIPFMKTRAKTVT